MRPHTLLALALAAPLLAAPASARTWNQDWTVGAAPGAPRRDERRAASASTAGPPAR